MNFSVNQTVKGANFGIFVIIGLRTVAGSTEHYAQLKELSPVTGRRLPGVIVLPFSALRALPEAA